MKKVFLTSILGLSMATSFAQDAKCPIKILDWKGESIPTLGSSRVSFEYQNVSDKVITGVIVELSVRNLIGEETPYKVVPEFDEDFFLWKKPGPLQPQAVKRTAFSSTRRSVQMRVSSYTYMGSASKTVQRGGSVCLNRFPWLLSGDPV